MANSYANLARMRMTSSTAVRSLWNWLCVGHGCRPTVHRCTGRRLEIVCCFARYLAIFEPDTEIPGQQLLGPAHCRNVPHVYSDAEVSALLAGARRLKPIDGLRPRTYTTLIGLLVCTGLRISEALRLAGTILMIVAEH